VSRGLSACSPGLLSVVAVSCVPCLLGFALTVARTGGLPGVAACCAGAERGSLVSAETGGAGCAGGLGEAVCTGALGTDGGFTFTAPGLGAGSTGAGAGEDQNPAKCATK